MDKEKLRTKELRHHLLDILDQFQAHLESPQQFQFLNYCADQESPPIATRPALSYSRCLFLEA